MVKMKPKRRLTSFQNRNIVNLFVYSSDKEKKKKKVRLNFASRRQGCLLLRRAVRGQQPTEPTVSKRDTLVCNQSIPLLV